MRLGYDGRMTALAALLLAVQLFAGEWPAFGADAARTGAVGNGVLDAAQAARLHPAFRATLGDVADAAPILFSGMLYITTKSGTTVALNARDGHVEWRFESHGPGITTSVPVADPNRKWVYAPGVDGFVHRLDARTGKEDRSRGFPVRITTMPQSEKDAAALNLANGYLYAATSGYFGDAPPYAGHVVTVRLSDGATHVFNTLCSNDRRLPTGSSCSQSGSGIWSRGGVVVDPDPSMNGRIYAATGNGRFNASSGGRDYGDSIVALDRDGSALADYYTPSTYAQLDSGDTDLGSTSPAMLPRQSRSRTPLLAVMGGKDGELRLLDRRHLGAVGHEVQRIDAGEALFATPAVWNDGGTAWIFLGLAQGVHAYRLETDARGASRLVSAWSESAGQSREGTTPAVSNGVLFYAASGTLYALDARSGRKLWTGSIGDVHWQSPIVAAGRVYCADEDGKLNAFAI